MALRVQIVNSFYVDLIRHIQHCHDSKQYYNALVFKAVFEQANVQHLNGPLEVHFVDNHFCNVEILDYKSLHGVLSKFFHSVKFFSDNPADEFLDPDYFVTLLPKHLIESAENFFYNTLNSGTKISYESSMKMFGLYVLRPDVHRLAILTEFERLNLWPFTDCKVGFTSNSLMADETWRSSGIDLCAKTMSISHMDILNLVAKLPTSDRFFQKKGQDIETKQDQLLDLQKNTINKNFLIEIICDSSHGDHVSAISEKILRCWLLRQPFIILGHKNTYQNLHKYGIRTFNEFWNENWDNFNSTELESKVKFIGTTCKQIADTYTVKDLMQLTADITEHNYRLVKENYHDMVDFFNSTRVYK